MSARALSFGAIAQAYETFRPGYPEELYELVRDYAGRPVRTALEIGAGTGKATRLFAGHGVAVTATDPDAAMLTELRRTAPATVTTVQAAFEQLPPTAGPFDLVYATAALHWTSAEGRWPRVAALLAPGGVFASCGGPMELADPAVAEAVRVARLPFLESDDIPSPDGTAPEEPMQWPGSELLRSALFTDVQQHLLPRRMTMTPAAYVGYLSTVSAYLQLDPERRRQAFAAITGALPATVEISADLVLHLARTD